MNYITENKYPQQLQCNDKCSDFVTLFQDLQVLTNPNRP